MTAKFETPSAVYDRLQKIRPALPESVVPDFELRYKSELVSQINQLAVEKNAVILLHNYMEPVLFYAVNGYKGDSLELSRRAAETQNDRIVFCGVHFMAESAKILNPSKTVLIPSQEAGCSLADGITPENVRDLKARFPGLPVVTYVNSTAAVKAETDVCCSSGNLKKVIPWALQEFGTKSLIFIPDKYMARNVATENGMAIVFPGQDPRFDKEIDLNKPTIIGWDARCYVHEQYTVEHVKQIRATYPDALVLAHPECPPDVIAAADGSGSTSAMMRMVETQGHNRRIALLTECSMADNIVASHPEVNENLIRMCNLRCRYMHMITLEQVRDALLYDRYQVQVPEDIRKKAEIAVRRMIAIG